MAHYQSTNGMSSKLKARKDNRIGIGIIGASPIHPGWAVKAHLPVLKALPDYELRVVSTSRRDSAGSVRWKE
jgi:predicted dehydrogenase